MYIKILILAVGVFLLFRLLAMLQKYLPFSKKIKQYFEYFIPVVEIAAWLGFAIWCIRFIYEAQNYTALIIFGTAFSLLLIPSWFLIRDFLFGVILKMQQKIVTGNAVEIEEIKGVIISSGYFAFDIKTKSGTIDSIPYNKLRSKIISKPTGNIHLEKHAIQLTLNSKLDKTKVKQNLKKTILNAPWVTISQEPIIKDISYENEIYTIDLIVFTLNQNHADRIKDYVLKNF